MNALIAQSSNTGPTATSQPFSLDSGVAIVALLVLIVKEGVIFIKKKEAEESRLTSDLIQDLRKDRSEQLGQMQTIIHRLNTSHDRVAAAIHKMSIVIAGVNETLTKQDRTNVAIQQSIRELDKQMVLLNARIERIVYLYPENDATDGRLQPQQGDPVRNGSGKTGS